MIRGVAVGWMAHLCGLCVTFFTTPIIILALGPTNYGIWSIVISFTSYYGLIDLGLGKATAKFVAQFDSLGDEDSVRRVLATTQRTYVVLGLVVVVLAVGLGWLFPYVFSIGDHSVVAIRTVVLLVGARMASLLVSSVYRAALEGKQRFDVTTSVAIASQMATAASVVAVLSYGGGIVQMAIVVFAVGLLTDAATWQIAVRAIGLPCFSWSDADSRTRRMMLGFGLLTVLTNTARGLGQKSGTVLGGLLAGPSAAAYYAAAESIADKCLKLGKPVAQCTMPSSSHFQASKQHAELRRMAEVSLRVSLAMGLVLASTLCIFGHSFLTHWISREFADHSFPVFSVLVVSLVATLPGNAIIEIFQGLGRTRLSAILSVAELFLIVALGLLLIPIMGIVGMAYAILVPAVLVRGILLPICLCGIIEYAASRYIKRIVIRAVGVLIPVLIVATGVRLAASSTSLVGDMIQIAAVMGVGVCSVFFLCVPSRIRRLSIAAVIGERWNRRSRETTADCCSVE